MHTLNLFSQSLSISTPIYILLMGFVLLIILLLFWRIVWHHVPPKSVLLLTLSLWLLPALVAVPYYSFRVASTQSSRSIQGSIEAEFWACGVELQPTLAQTTESQGASFWFQAPFESDKRWWHSGASTASITAFLQSIGGSIQADSVVLPVDEHPENWLMHAQSQDGDPQGSISALEIEKYVKADSNKTTLSFTSGQACPGSSEPAELQIFVYRTNDNQTYSQHKVVNPQDFILQLGQHTPPGDCMIVEFDTPKNSTTKLCPSYGRIDNKRCATFTNESVNLESCTFREVNADVSEKNQ